MAQKFVKSGVKFHLGFKINVRYNGVFAKSGVFSMVFYRQNPRDRNKEVDIIGKSINAGVVISRFNCMKNLIISGNYRFGASIAESSWI